MARSLMHPEFTLECGDSPLEGKRKSLWGLELVGVCAGGKNKVFNYGNNMRGGIKAEPRFENDIPSIHANVGYVVQKFERVRRTEPFQNSIPGTSTPRIIVTVAS